MIPGEAPFLTSRWFLGRTAIWLLTSEAHRKESSRGIDAAKQIEWGWNRLPSRRRDGCFGRAFFGLRLIETPAGGLYRGATPEVLQQSSRHQFRLQNLGEWPSR